jgi:excisionase family DNA binding protein
MATERLTAAQAAARIGVSVRQLTRYVAAGLISPERTPGGHRRFSSEDVDALLARQTTT